MYQDFLDLTARLGLELSIPKCVPPNMRVDIPETKLAEVLTECARWETARKASQKDRQYLIGKMQNIAKCVRPVRRFMIPTALWATPFTSRHIMPPDIVLDIEWFCRYAAEANGVVLLRDNDSPTWVIESDSFHQGGGANSQNVFYSARYSPQLQTKGPGITQL